MPTLGEIRTTLSTVRMAALCAGVALGGCTSSAELVGDPLVGLVAIELEPASATVVVDDLATSQRVAFTAIGVFEGGDRRDVTESVGWGLDRAAPGGFVAPGAWESSNRAGGRVTIEARSDAVASTASLTVVFEPVIVDPLAPPTGDVEELFDPQKPVEVGDPLAGPRIVYPADEVMFPLNLYRVLFQYLAGERTDVYRIRFQSPLLDMQVFTTSDRWEADANTWDFLALTGAGGRLSMTVAGVDSADPQVIYESLPIDLHFSESAVEGAIFYWSTSSKGVMKGVISQPAPTKFYPEPGNGTCVACHTVSRDGTALAVGYDGETLQSVTIPDRDVMIPASRGYDMGWSTFSPDASLLLLASKGTLQLVDAGSGDPVGPNGGVVDLGQVEVTHPDWSPQGDYVAVALCEKADNDKDVEGCSIARIPYAGGAWGAPEVLVPATGPDDNNFFPRYSPDGAWIAYVYAAGKSKNQPLAALQVVPAAGGEPVALTLANQRVGPEDDVADTGSTMPTWAPSTHPGTMWLAFSSIRDYGVVLVGDKADQLWVVAVDIARAAQGQDPSYAAFWLPLQDVQERNHRAFWAIDADQPCAGSVEVCDGFDNDCDGAIDEDCTPCADQEICVDGVDNDCDGAIDDGCIS